MFFQLLKVLNVLSITFLIQAICDLSFKSIADLLPCHVTLEKMLLLKITGSFSCFHLKNYQVSSVWETLRHVFTYRCIWEIQNDV